MLKQQVSELTSLLRAMQETSELQAATLQEMQNSNKKDEEEVKAEFFNFGLLCKA